MNVNYSSSSSDMYNTSGFLNEVAGITAVPTSSSFRCPYTSTSFVGGATNETFHTHPMNDESRLIDSVLRRSLRVSEQQQQSFLSSLQQQQVSTKFLPHKQHDATEPAFTSKLFAPKAEVVFTGSSNDCWGATTPTAKSVIGDHNNFVLRKKNRSSYSYSLHKAELSRLHDTLEAVKRSSTVYNKNDERSVRFEIDPSTDNVRAKEITIPPVVIEDLHQLDNDEIEDRIEARPRLGGSMTKKRRGRKRNPVENLESCNQQSNDNSASEKQQIKKVIQFYDRRESRKAWRMSKKAAESFLSQQGGNNRQLALELQRYWSTIVSTSNSANEAENSKEQIEESDLIQFLTQWSESEGRGLEHPILLSMLVSTSINDEDEKMNDSFNTASITLDLENDSSPATNNTDFVKLDAARREKLLSQEIARKLAIADAIIAKTI